MPTDTQPETDGFMLAFILLCSLQNTVYPTAMVCFDSSERPDFVSTESAEDVTDVSDGTVTVESALPVEASCALTPDANNSKIKIVLIFLITPSEI